MARLYRLLTGDDAGPDAHLSAEMLTAAIGGAVMHLIVADLDDDTLRSQLLRSARGFLDLPDRAGSRPRQALNGSSRNFTTGVAAGNDSVTPELK